jgi:hypothetical protein
MIRAIAVDEFHPFGKLLLKFPSVEKEPHDLAEVHLFRGINGTGKTPILSLLGATLGSRHALAARLPYVGEINDVALITFNRGPC